MSNKYHLPKKYLSYSAISLWYKSPEEFKKRYFLGQPSPTSPYMMFGKEVAEALESGSYPLIPRFTHSEFKIEVEVEGVKILGYLDSFEKDTGKIMEYKSGIPHKDGKPRWTQAEVQKLDQLPFYSMLVKEKFSLFKPWVKLVYLETEWCEDTVQEEFDGHMLDKKVNRLQLNGNITEFNRRIELWEHERMVDWIVRAAEQISDAYERHSETLDAQEL